MAAGSGVSHPARAYGASWRRPAWTSSGTDGAWAARRSSFARRSGSGSRRRSGGSSAQPPPGRIQQACPADAPVGTWASSRGDFRVMEWTDESHQRAAAAVALLLGQQSGHQRADQLPAATGVRQPVALVCTSLVHALCRGCPATGWLMLPGAPQARLRAGSRPARTSAGSPIWRSGCQGVGVDGHVWLVVRG